MTAESLEQQIEQAKREFDAAIGRADEVIAAWAKLSALVQRRSELQDDQASEPPA
jgi:hypothetical protein